MKKTFLTLFATAVTFITFAQNEFGVQLNGGLSKFTPRFLRMEDKYVKDLAKFSYLFGVYYETPLNEKLDLGFGLNYNNTKSVENSNASDSEGTLWRDQYSKVMTNIGVPIYLEINTSEKMFFDVGLRFSINVDSENHFIGRENTMIYYERIYKLNVKKIQFGGQVGVGYQINDDIAVFTNFYRDIMSLENSQGEEGMGLRSWQLHLGLKYALKK
jgi:hypothetical protein